MTASRLALEYEPRLVEGAVLLAVAGGGGGGGRGEERRFRAERARFYRVADGAEREMGFDTFHAAWFARLALDRPFCEALEGQPACGDRIRGWLLPPARGGGGQGAAPPRPP